MRKGAKSIMGVQLLGLDRSSHPSYCIVSLGGHRITAFNQCWRLFSGSAFPSSYAPALFSMSIKEPVSLVWCLQNCTMLAI